MARDQLNKAALWLRLREYNFGDIVPPGLWEQLAGKFGRVDPSTRAFANKIARKHDWSPGFALRAVNEYRKFVYLGVTGSTVVTPSRVIDTVWHEHLLFTRAYRAFCQDVLHREFDHHPELLPTAEQSERFAVQFEATLARYHDEFHRAPPPDIWSKTKFNRDGVRSTADVPLADVGAAAETPLYLLFDGQGGMPSHVDMPEFGSGFSGGGGGSEWGNGHADSGGNGSGSGGGDAGSDGGSGCSSGCGSD